MKSFLKVLTTVALAVSGADALKDGLSVSGLCGGPHGDFKTNLGDVRPGQKVKYIALRADERVDAVMVGVEIDGAPNEFYHGGDGGKKKVLDLLEGEYINKIDCHWGKKDDKTRVFYIKFSTNKGNYLDGGTQTDDQYSEEAPLGYQLGGFQGFSKQELDMTSAIWTSIKPIPPLPSSDLIESPDQD